MKRITTQERKNIQLTLLDEIDSFCRANGLRYTLAYGTLLGAVRHKGYIPWDDDIDIAMLREDYDKFVANFKVSDKPYVVVHDYTNDVTYDQPFAKVSDERTIFYEKGTYAKDVGLFVDVFPIDNLYDTEEQSVEYLKKIRWVKILRDVKYLKPSNNRKTWKNVGIILVRPFLFGISIRKLTGKILEHAKKRENILSKYVGVVCDTFIHYESVIERSVFENYIDLQFEDRVYKCIRDYDRYLTNEYGDYMTPVKDRPSHNIEENSFWK